MARGGYRPGAGRPAKEQTLHPQQVNVQLTPEQLAYVDGQVSALGITRQEVLRRIVDYVRQQRARRW